MSIYPLKIFQIFTRRMAAYKEQALEILTCELLKGKITAIYGPSGCGKTSLLNIISGLIEALGEQLLRRTSQGCQVN